MLNYSRAIPDVHEGELKERKMENIREYCLRRSSVILSMIIVINLTE